MTAGWHKAYDRVHMGNGKSLHARKEHGLSKLIAECRAECEAMTGVPGMTEGQLTVAVLTDWLRMRREARAVKP